ncbi:transmembrane protein [Legionella beliardensis]|uniref:Transmembrane protein n=1 Tax=Legionella beliardensis TaxID=91822 RepID=A0A378I546_9GAMM|nr:hypothetical protein [Legionella beliardensis]STX29826.1 transmembrane protein [Legionella beliardensis]
MNRMLSVIGMMLVITLVHADLARWTFKPLTATKITVPANDTATIKYQITNQSIIPYKLAMKPIIGVKQITTAGYCPKNFVLGYKESCILNLTINGRALSGNIKGGPVVCSQCIWSKCYKPSLNDVLRITKGPAANYTIGGAVFGLHGRLILVNNGHDKLILNTDGTYTFPKALSPGRSYAITIKNQPRNQTCTVSNGNGVVTKANVANIVVNCSTHVYTVGGSVSGLASSESLVLQNNGSDTLTVNSNSSFTFIEPVAQGAIYDVTILQQPKTQRCTLANKRGRIKTSNITNVQVTCATKAYTVGGKVLSLDGTVVLQNNGMDDLSIHNNGPFTFPTPITKDATYHVTVRHHPETQNCKVTNPSGTIGEANVRNVGITCTTNTTALTMSVNKLALSAAGIIEYGINGAPNSGLARIITIENTGNLPATNFTVNLPAWPEGTTSTTTCENILTAGDHCIITIIPGNTATSDGTNPCSSGTSPIPGIIRVTADNASAISSEVVVLNYGCIYQGGYVYAFDDSTADTQSVGGKVVTLADQAPPHPNGVIWSSNGNGNTPDDAAYDSIFGVSNRSTPSAPIPNIGQVAGQNACNGSQDGACNTDNIYLFYQNNAKGAPIDPAYYAAAYCKQTINDYSDWYLPAMCEMGYGDAICGTSSTPTLQNIQSSLVDNGLISLLGYYWSSTQTTHGPQYSAWYQYFAPDGKSVQLFVSKFNRLGLRCSRHLDSV